MREFGVRPNRELGQNFLVDSNMLDVIARAATSVPTTSCSRSAAASASSASISPSAPLTSTSSSSIAASSRRCATRSIASTNVTLHFADAVKLDLAALDPPVGKVVANLPVRRRRDGDPQHGRRSRPVPRVGWRWCSARSASAWRRRRAPRPTARRRCSRSSRARCACCDPSRGASSSPVPNVDSVLVGLERTAPPAPAALRKLVSAGFAHRRKALPRSLSLAPGARARRPRPRRAPRSTAMGRPADERAERLAPGRLGRAPLHLGCDVVQ